MGLQNAVFDLEHPRLVTFTFQLEDGRKGTADVDIVGAKQYVARLDEWILAIHFLPHGLTTVMASTIGAEFIYSARKREGCITRLDEQTITGHPVSDWLKLFTWKG